MSPYGDWKFQDRVFSCEECTFICLRVRWKPHLADTSSRLWNRQLENLTLHIERFTYNIQ